MSYFLGIDLGTTYTAAAVWRKERVEVAVLGGRAPVIPSVVLIREDGHALVGQAATRRGLVEPHRVAREFKRRIGDQTPIIVAGAPHSAESLMARLLRAVVRTVVDGQDGPPDGIAVTHPANWTTYKQDLLRQAAHLADLGEVTLVPEPEAAAIHYASQERVDPGHVVAAYDLGGGTFDAAVLRRTATGWQILGQPDGVERLGGVDFDQAVFHHVVTAAGPAYDCLDPEDPAAMAAVTRLRQECIDAKEALTSDTDVTIPVLLPTLHSSVRLTRAEFEDMVRPALGDTITALRRALRSAAVEPQDVSAVLLVGGSSRIPLVARMVSSALGRPVAVDAHPKHSVALGAAILAADRASPGAAGTDEVEPAEKAQARSPVRTAPATPADEVEPAEKAQARSPVWTAPATRAASAGGVAAPPAPIPAPARAVARAPAPAVRPEPRGAGPPPPGPRSRARWSARQAVPAPRRQPPPRTAPPRREHRSRSELAEVEARRRRALVLVAGGAATLVVAFGSVALSRMGTRGETPDDQEGIPAHVFPRATDTPGPQRSTGESRAPTSTTALLEQHGSSTSTPSARANPTPTEPTTTVASTTTTPASTTTSTVASTTTVVDPTTSSSVPDDP